MWVIDNLNYYDIQSSEAMRGLVMRIGYQGAVGSNADQAAHDMAEALGFQNVEFKPLISSQRVVTSLKLGEIDYGVVAIKNSIGGRVEETFDAIRDEQLELVRTEIIDIHHCLFKFPGVPLEDLKYVASHVQALKQTRETRAKRFPQLEEEEIADTAIGAEWLANGRLDTNHAVLCKAAAGDLNGLELVDENLEDEKNNRTEFRMFKRPSMSYENDEPPTIEDRIVHACVTQTGLGVLSKVFVVFGIFGALLVAGSSFLDSFELATTIGGIVSALFLYLSSSRAQDIVQFRSLKGFWKYYSVPDEGHEGNIDLLYEIPRIVEVDEVDDELYMKGWICDKAAIPFFESQKTIVSPSDKAHGSLVYWYQDPREVGRGVALNGFAELNWLKKYPASKINKMSGRYSGRSTGETGTIVFYRITKTEFDVHRNCEFLGKSHSSS